MRGPTRAEKALVKEIVRITRDGEWVYGTGGNLLRTHGVHTKYDRTIAASEWVKVGDDDIRIAFSWCHNMPTPGELFTVKISLYVNGHVRAQWTEFRFPWRWHSRRKGLAEADPAEAWLAIAKRIDPPTSRALLPDATDLGQAINAAAETAKETAR